MHRKGNRFDYSKQVFLLLFYKNMLQNINRRPVRMPECWWYVCG